MNRDRWLACLRASVVVAAVIAASASATSPPPQPSRSGPPGTHASQPQAYGQAPCDRACAQIARCNVATFEACLAECRSSGAELQPGGPEHLALVASASCEQLAAATQAQAPAPHAPSATTTHTAATGPSQLGAIEADYHAPPGYTESRQGQSVVFTPARLDETTPCVYGLAPSRASSGSLEHDALAAVVEPLAGWQRGHQEPTHIRGTSPTGWSYHFTRVGVQRMNNGSYEYLNAMAMAFPASRGRVNIVFGFGSNVNCLADDASFARLFYGLRPHGWQSDRANALRVELLGGWRLDAGYGQARATRAYVFREDGRYVDILHTTAQIGYTETIRTGAGDGDWTLRDDGVLVMTPDRKDRGTETFRVRVFEEQARWRKLAMLRDSDARELVFERTSLK